MPVLILLFVSPFVGELLLGSSPWHLLHAYPALLPLHVALYGSGAILIRELTRRAGRGWPSLLLLALAYGLVEEGLGDLSLWNPDYQGLRLLDLASFAGIGWFHWLHVLTMHVVWSMGTSIGLVEALFPARAGRPWLNAPGLGAIAGLFVLAALATHVLAGGGYALSPAQFGATLLLIALLVLAAATLPRRAPGSASRSLPADVPTCQHAGVAGAFACVASTAFMLLHPRFVGPNVPGAVLVAGDLVLYATTIVCLRRWSPAPYALATGALFTYVWYGYVLVHADLGDLIVQVVFTLAALGLVYLVAKRQARAHDRHQPRTLEAAAAARSM